MANDLDEIQTRVRDLVVDVTPFVVDHLDETIRHAQEVLEDRHNFKVMEEEVTYVTATDTRLLSALPADWKEPRLRPWIVDGTGHSSQIDWMPTITDRNILYNPDDPLDRGAPKHILETETGLDVYPLPDGLAPNGPVFSDGQWRVHIPYVKRLQSLTLPSDANWFTANAKDFLIFHAAGELMYANRDHQEAALYLLPGDRMGGRAGSELSRLKRRDRRARLAGVPLLVPRTRVYGPTSQSRR